MSSFQNFMAAITLVIEKNVPYVFHVHTNLVGTPRLKDTLYESHISQAFQHPVMSDGMFALVIGKNRHLHAVFGVAPDVAHYGAFILLHIPPDQRTVAAFRRFIEKLVAQMSFGIRGLGYHQQAGSILVGAQVPHADHWRRNRDYLSCARLWH